MSSSTTISLTHNFADFYTSRGSDTFWIWRWSSRFGWQARSVRSWKEKQTSYVTHLVFSLSKIVILLLSRKSWLESYPLVNLQKFWLTFRPRIVLEAVTSTTNTALPHPPSFNKLCLENIHVFVRSPKVETMIRSVTTLSMPEVHQDIPKVFKFHRFYRRHTKAATISHINLTMMILWNQIISNKCSWKTNYPKISSKTLTKLFNSKIFAPFNILCQKSRRLTSLYLCLVARHVASSLSRSWRHCRTPV